MTLINIFVLYPLLACLAIARMAASSQYLDWKTFDAVGVNLGGWLEQESTIDTTWWSLYSGGALDERELCADLGSQCGPVLERRYATWITTSDIDTLGAAGINLLRIPTIYTAWVDVPGSQLYHGNQVSFLSSIASYAINKYGMHIIIDIHSLPGVSMASRLVKLTDIMADSTMQLLLSIPWKLSMRLLLSFKTRAHLNHSRSSQSMSLSTSKIFHYSKHHIALPIVGPHTWQAIFTNLFLRSRP